MRVQPGGEALVPLDDRVAGNEILGEGGEGK
jgi:hypothetical protein